jgi:division protein CdvB (Snf7/Vps24/ESCRT-III family)
MSHAAEISMMQALMKVSDARERVREALARIDHAAQMDRLTGIIDLREDLAAQHESLKRLADELTQRISGRKAVTA